MNGVFVGSNQLSVQRVPPHMASLLLVQAPTPTANGGDPLLNCPPSCILKLSNMVSENDLTDDELYQELQVFHNTYLHFFLS